MVSDVFRDFNDLLSTRRSNAESYRSFENRFAAQVAKFNSNGTCTQLPESLTALMLLANASVDNSQRVAVLAAAAPTDSSFTNQSSNDEFMKAVSYSSVSSVLRQCDKPKSNSIEDHNPISSNSAATFHSSFSNHSSRRDRSYARNKKKLSPDQLADLKSRSRCHKCSKLGHWSTDHNVDGSLMSNTRSFDNSRNWNGAPPKRNVVSFNMGNMPSDSPITFAPAHLDPLVDDGAPYSAIGQNELNLLQPHLLPNWNGDVPPRPRSLENRRFWQYGNGSHASLQRLIVGSVVLSLTADCGSTVQVRHLVLDGSSQWVIGRNVTHQSDIVHVDGNLLSIPKPHNNRITVSMIDHDLHSYIPFASFMRAAPSVLTANLSLSNALQSKPQTKSWTELKHVIDKVHKHVCGHATFSDIGILLDRNDLWSDEVEHYLRSVVEECHHCKAACLPTPSRKVSLSSLSRSFNEVVCVDHFYLDNIRMFHMMDAWSRFSTCYALDDASLRSAVIGFEASWLSKFWAPLSVRGDDAFNKDEFKNYMSTLDIEFRPIPPRRHSKNVLESKHGIIGSVYLRLKSANDSDESDTLLAHQAVRMSNDLYGSDTLSAFELANGFTKPVVSGTVPNAVTDELIAAQDTLAAKRKLTLILRSKAVSTPSISVGDLVQIYVKRDKEKRGKWFSPRTVLSFDKIAGIVTVDGAAGKTISAGVEDVRPAICNEEFALHVQEAIDCLDQSLDEILEPSPDSSIVQDTATTRADDVIFEGDVSKTFPATGDDIDVFGPLTAATTPELFRALTKMVATIYHILMVIRRNSTLLLRIGALHSLLYLLYLLRLLPPTSSVLNKMC